MKTMRFSHFDNALKTKAEQFFGMAFDAVTFCVSDRPARFGARAYAQGSTLHFQPKYSDFSKRANLALLGHELTHLAQQREGRVVPNGTVNGVALADDPGLEAEAWRLGWRFAAGLPCDKDFAVTHSPVDPVMQRAVLIDGKPIEGTTSLESEPATVLNMIEGASAWLDWASKDTNVRYEFENQLLLTQAIQIGLHGVSLLLLNKLALYVSPLTLLTLDAKDFKVITDFELGIGQQRGAKMFAVNAMRANNLLSQSELETVPGLLENWKMTGQPVFQALGLADSIVLYNLGQWVDGQDDIDAHAQRTAAGFAVGLAQSPQEFADYFQYYLTLSQKLDWDNQSDSQADKKYATSLIYQLMPVLRNVLRAAVLDYRPSTDVLHTFVGDWQDMGFPLGFQRFSAAVNQVVLHTTVGDPEQQMIPIVQSYIEASQAFIRNHQADEMALSQNGEVTRYGIDNEEATAILDWNQAGTLTLESFTVKSATQPETTPDKSKAIPKKGTSHGTQKGKSDTQKDDEKDA